MKRIGYFIGLKIAEIGGGVIVYYLLCLLAGKLHIDEPFWLSGLLLTCYIGLALCALTAIVYFLQWNWGISKRLADK